MRSAVFAISRQRPPPARPTTIDPAMIPFSHRTYLLWIGWFAAIVAIAWSPPVAGQVVSLKWENVPLGTALGRLSRAADVAIHLDRRVDPSQRVALDARDATAESVLAELARDHPFGVTNVGPLWYVGPVETCAALRTLVAVRDDEVAQLPTRRRDPLARRAETTWPRLTEPRALVERLAEDAGLKLRGSEKIPHDLWPAGRLPELTLTARLTILLAGFDQTFAIRDGGRTLEIVPLDRQVTLRASYDVLAQRGVELADLQRRFPDARLTLADGKVTLDGRWEDHERLQQLLGSATQPARRPRRRRVDTRQVFTLRVQDQPLRPLIEQLAQRLELEVVWDEHALRSAETTPQSRVSFAVENVDLDDLLEAALRPAGLTFRRDGQRVEIIPASER